MPIHADLSILITLAPLEPKDHWELLGRLRSRLGPLGGRAEPTFLYPVFPNLSCDPEQLSDDAYRLWKSIPSHSVAPFGFAGAPELALTSEELNREVTWAGGNDRGFGTTIYGYDRLRAPVLADLPRLPRSLPTLLGVFREARRERLLIEAEGELRSLPCLRVQDEWESPERDLKSLLRAGTRENSPVALIFAPGEEREIAGQLDRLGEAIRESRSLSRGVSISPLRPREGRIEEDERVSLLARMLPPGSSPFSPALSTGLYRAAQHRAEGTPGEETHRRVLLSFSKAAEGGEAFRERNTTYASQRVYTAAMHGLAEVAGDRFALRTWRGRPTELCGATQSVGTGQAATTTLRRAEDLRVVAKELCSTDSISAFAFEGELSRGLREETGVAGALTGRVRLDSYFLSEQEELFLSMEIEVAGRLEEAALLIPVEFPLAEARRREPVTMAVERIIAGEAGISEEQSLAEAALIPLFATETALSLPDGGVLKAAAADLWKNAIVPMALGRLPAEGRRGRDRIIFAPFGIFELAAGERVNLNVRRSVRLSIGADSRFAPLSRGLERDLLLWEDRSDMR